MTTIKTENMVTLQLSLEAFGFTGMNKQEVEAAILNAVQCQLVFTKSNGKKFQMESVFEPKIESIIVEDEDGNEITSADHISL